MGFFKKFLHIQFVSFSFLCLNAGVDHVALIMIRMAVFLYACMLNIESRFPTETRHGSES